MRCGRGPCPLGKTVGYRDSSFPAAGKSSKPASPDDWGALRRSLVRGSRNAGRLHFTRVTEQTSGFPGCVDVSPATFLLRSPILKSTSEARLDFLRGTRRAKLVPKVGVRFQGAEIGRTPRPRVLLVPKALGRAPPGCPRPESRGARWRVSFRLLWPRPLLHQSKSPPCLGHRNPQGRPERTSTDADPDAQFLET